MRKVTGKLNVSTRTGHTASTTQDCHAALGRSIADARLLVTGDGQGAAGTRDAFLCRDMTCPGAGHPAGHGVGRQVGHRTGRMGCGSASGPWPQASACATQPGLLWPAEAQTHRLARLAGAILASRRSSEWPGDRTARPAEALALADSSLVPGEQQQARRHVIGTTSLTANPACSAPLLQACAH